MGLVQGLTEFIPVSSSGHLVIANALFKNNDAFAFDVLLNFGTLAALLVYYRSRIWGIAKDILMNRKFGLAGKLFVATIPVVLIGYAFESVFSNLNDNLLVVIAMLAIMGGLMIIFGNARPHASHEPLEKVSTLRFLLVGVAQVFALIPGTSRSGITILAGMRQNLSAERAAELSFLLAIPTIFGASIKTLVSTDGQRFIQDHLELVLLGNLVSFAAGLLAIGFLIKLLHTYGLVPFGWYRLALAAVLILLVSVKIL